MEVSSKGICEWYRNTGVSMQFKYQEGQKHYRSCGNFIECDDIRCLCCHMILRTNARNRMSKIKRFTKVTNKH